MRCSESEVTMMNSTTVVDKTVQKKVLTLFVYADRDEQWHATSSPDHLYTDVMEHGFRISGWMESENANFCWIEVDDPDKPKPTMMRVPLDGRNYKQVVFDEARREARERELPFVAGLDPR